MVVRMAADMVVDTHKVEHTVEGIPVEVVEVVHMVVHMVERMQVEAADMWVLLFQTYHY